MNHKKLSYLFMTLALLFLLAGCAGVGTENVAPESVPEAESAVPEIVLETESADTDRESETASAPDEPQETDSETPDLENADAGETETHSEETGESSQTATGKLVVYFSRIGEQYSVGVIEKGNTAIVAEMVAERTGADVFEITPAVDNYPTDNYRALTDIGLQEQKDGARPAIATDVENFADYDTVFLGYPIWWGDLPMILYTFLETHDFSGKTIVPFCTHGGSQMAGTAAKIEGVVTADAVLNGLAIEGTDAQNNRDSVRETVNDWLAGLGY